MGFAPFLLNIDDRGKRYSIGEKSLRWLYKISSNIAAESLYLECSYVVLRIQPALHRKCGIVRQTLISVFVFCCLYVVFILVAERCCFLQPNIFVYNTSLCLAVGGVNKFIPKKKIILFGWLTENCYLCTRKNEICTLSSVGRATDS